MNIEGSSVIHMIGASKGIMIVGFRAFGDVWSHLGLAQFFLFCILDLFNNFFFCTYLFIFINFKEGRRLI